MKSEIPKPISTLKEWNERVWEGVMGRCEMVCWGKFFIDEDHNPASMKKLHPEVVVYLTGPYIMRCPAFAEGVTLKSILAARTDEELYCPILDLRGQDLSSCNLSHGYFVGALLNRVNLSKADLRGVDFSHAKLMYANLNGADLRGARLKGAKLDHATYKEANLAGADLEDVNLDHAILNMVDCTGANLRNTNLSNASLVGTNLENADLSGADFQGVVFIGLRENAEGKVCIVFANLHKAKNVPQDAMENFKQQIASIVEEFSDDRDVKLPGYREIVAVHEELQKSGMIAPAPPVAFATGQPTLRVPAADKTGPTP